MTGALLAGAARVGSAVTHARWLASPAPLWIPILAGTTSLVLAAYLVRGSSARRRVLVVVPAFVQKHWLAGFFKNVVHVLDSQGYDTVLKLPVHDYSGQGQLLQLNSARRRIRDYAGAFISPAAPESIQHELRSFCAIAGFPVIFVDVKPFAEQDYPSGSAFVGSDQKEIGAIGARWSAAQLNQSNKTQPKILIVSGKTQGERQREFAAVIRDK